MRYVVSIAGRTVEVEVTGGDVRVNGHTHQAELLVVPGTPVRNLLVDGTSWIVPMEERGRGRWLIQRRGQPFEVEVLDERTHHIQGLIAAGKGPAGPAVLKAPMPGLVVRVLVEPGQTVAAGQGLVVLEAMKMENELKAGGPGVVDQISARAGEAVEKGAQLVSFKPAQT